MSSLNTNNLHICMEKWNERNWSPCLPLAVSIWLQVFPRNKAVEFRCYLPWSFYLFEFPYSFISDWESLFKYCNTKFFEAKGFSLIDLGFDYKVYGSSQWFANLSRGGSGFYVTNLVYSLLNIFMHSMEKWENIPLLMTGVDEMIPTCMVCKVIWDMQIH